MLEQYLNKLNYQDMPVFLKKYLECTTLIHLKKISYFCGMDYASNDIYNLNERITRYDHSLTTALLTWNLTLDKQATIAALFHDAATPCFSHAIDYMNKDYGKQESTEEFISMILYSDKWLNRCLKEDKIDIKNIINFKNFSVVDSERPKLCADRLDGIILTGSVLIKDIDNTDVEKIIDDIALFNNEDNELEIGFKSLEVANKIINTNNKINAFFHSKDDYHMMELLAKMAKYAIDNNYIKYGNLYSYNEKEMFDLFENINDFTLNNYLFEFKNIKSLDIKEVEMPRIKTHTLKLIVNGKRIN